MHLISTPQTRKYMIEGNKMTVYRYDPNSDNWLEMTKPDEDAGQDQVPEKKERHWLLTAIPLWLITIAFSLFLFGHRHLIAYVGDHKIMDISYSILGNQLHNITLFDRHGEKAAKLSQGNNWGIEKCIYERTGEVEGTHMTTIYQNGYLVARIENYGPDNQRILCYSQNGLLTSYEETINGITREYFVTLTEEPAYNTEHPMEYFPREENTV